MANTYAIYTGTGSQATWAIPVSDWISDSHIIVQLDADGERYDVDSVDPSYSFSIDGSNIEFDVAPALDVKFIVMRDTLGKDYNDTALDYDFNDGSVVTADQLDGVYRHALYLAQEAADLAFRKAALTDNSVLAYDSSSEQWEALPLGLVYDSTNDTFGFGGTSQSDYKFRFNGDTLIREDGDANNGAVLTIENTDVTNQQATLIVAASTPQVQFNDLNGDTDKKYFLHTYQNGVYQLVAQDDAGNAKTTIPLRLQEDGKTVLGGTSSQNADASYQHTIYGDIIMQDDSGEATLTVQNTNAGANAAVLRLIADSPTVIWNDDGGATDQKLMQVGFGSGSMDFAFYPDGSGVAYAVPLQLTTNGTTAGVILNGLPTSDPLVAGQLWRDNNEVKVSTGSAVSRHLYDSGWVSSWGANTLGPNERGVVVMSTTVDAYFPFQVNVWWRSSSGSTVFEQLDSQPKLENGATLSSGLEVFYDSSTRELYIDTQDVALYGEVNGGGSTSSGAWTSGTNQIRVTIT